MEREILDSPRPHLLGLLRLQNLHGMNLFLLYPMRATQKTKTNLALDVNQSYLQPDRKNGSCYAWTHYGRPLDEHGDRRPVLESAS